MNAVSMSGDDTININGSLLTDLADANCVELTFPSEIAQVKTGKNGNSIYGLNEMGNQCEVKLRMIRGSTDDKFLNNLLAQQQNNFAGFVLMTGEFIKKVGDGEGNQASDTYILSGGVFTKIPEAKSNAEGDTEQSIVLYTMKFSQAPRAIG
jgi:hypothetical protein